MLMQWGRKERKGRVVRKEGSGWCRKKEKAEGMTRERSSTVKGKKMEKCVRKSRRGGSIEHVKREWDRESQ